MFNTLEIARVPSRRVARTVNTEMVLAYWLTSESPPASPRRRKPFCRPVCIRAEGLDSVEPFCAIPAVPRLVPLRGPDPAHERDLEQAIIDRLAAFLLEMGKGFCFVARQRRISLEGDHYCIDLVFYNRLLRCFVLLDLKLGKLSHQDLGQMQMYVN